jgi:hypothetical protein
MPGTDRVVVRPATGRLAPPSVLAVAPANASRWGWIGYVLAAAALPTVVLCARLRTVLTPDPPN